MKTRKIIALIVAAVLLLGMCLVFSSCSKEEFYEAETDSPVDGLICIARHKNFIENYDFDQYILYDPSTLVMYSMVSSGNGLTITALYNADGTPKLYTPEKAE